MANKQKRQHAEDFGTEFEEKVLQALNFIAENVEKINEKKG